MTLRALVAAAIACGVGCGTDPKGALELTLKLPTEADLRPNGMVTITVTATMPGETPIASTSVLEDDRFDAGELPVGDDVQLGVVLRDVSNRIVGVGEAGETVDVVGDRATEIAIPVRRPFVYAANGTGLYSFDPTLDPRDPAFQGKIAGVSMPQIAVSVGGDRLAIVGQGTVHVIETATNAVTGTIAIPAMPRDATAVPASSKLAIGHATGITVVDLDARTTATATVGPVDRVTVGPAADGSQVVYGLVGRIAPREVPYAECRGSSSLVVVSVDAPAAATPVSLGDAVSDLAAAPDTQLFAALSCAGKVARVTGAIEGPTVALTSVADLPSAAALTVAGDRVWAVGTKASIPECSGTCGPATVIECPAQSMDRLSWVTDGSRLVVESIPLGGGDPIKLEMPDRRETVIDGDDPARQHAQVLKAVGVVPVDLVALPGGQYVGVVTRSRYFVEEAPFALPCLDMTTGDWLLIDMASASVAQRVRTSCTGVIAAESPVNTNWFCDDPPAGEQREGTEGYMPSSIGALFGAR